MILSVVNMCEIGFSVTVLLYTADINPYTADEEADMRALGYFNRLGQSVDLRILVRDSDLRLKMTIEHRREFLKYLDDYDLFVYTEDDMHFDLRHLVSYVKESQWVANSSLSDHYLVGYQRYEENGIGMGHTQVLSDARALNGLNFIQYPHDLRMIHR